MVLMFYTTRFYRTVCPENNKRQCIGQRGENKGLTCETHYSWKYLSTQVLPRTHIHKAKEAKLRE